MSSISFFSLLSDKKEAKLMASFKESYFCIAKHKLRWTKIAIFRQNLFSDS